VLVALQHVQAIFILRHDVVVNEGSSRLRVLSRGPSLSLFNILLMIRGIWELDVPIVVHPLGWFFCLPGHGSIHFVPCIPLLLGALVYL